MEQQGQGNATHSQEAQQRSADVPKTPLNPQDQAKAASREALEAQQEAQEAIKRAYIKQITAQEKAEQASQQVIAQQETAKRVATQAATEAAEKAASEQKERTVKELHDSSVAQEAAHSALASFTANQPGNQQGTSTPSYQSGFIPYATAVQNASLPQQVQQGNPGAWQQEHPEHMKQDSNGMRSAQLCQEMLLQGANQMAHSATAQMAAAQNLAAGAPDPQSQQVAKERAEAAQRQMMMAQQLAAAAQAPDTAVQAASNLPGLFNMA